MGDGYSFDVINNLPDTFELQLAPYMIGAAAATMIFASDLAPPWTCFVATLLVQAVKSPELHNADIEDIIRLRPDLAGRIIGDALAEAIRKEAETRSAK